MNGMHVSHVSNRYRIRMQRTVCDELLFIREIYVNYKLQSIKYFVLINEVIIMKSCSTIFI